MQFASLLRRVVFVGETALCGLLDEECVAHRLAAGGYDGVVSVLGLGKPRGGFGGGVGEACLVLGVEDFSCGGCCSKRRRRLFDQAGQSCVGAGGHVVHRRHLACSYMVTIMLFTHAQQR